ncbi:MAG TPA: NADH-quinone oxidoreductase subunit NuoF [Thermoleophilia bacterium]|nr:NADH-quinone oxidoreductase subunit NuoF [Thermoleophilia bacterium]
MSAPPPKDGVRVEVAGGASGRRRISVCAGTACVFAGSLKIRDAFIEEVAAAGLGDQVDVRLSGCHGLCSQGPLAVVSGGDTYYPRLKLRDVKRVVEEHLVGGTPVEKLLYVDPVTGERVHCAHDIPFYRQQRRIALRDVGVIDPESLDEFLARGGYEAARKALTTMTPEAIIAEILASGLRGRGGAGFPTGMKWKFARQSPGDVKYVICNGDEGDPGAFMDASIMDGDPHAVLEGMLIASYAIGAREGYIYVRAEYPLAVRRLRLAIAEAEGRGLLGDDLFGSGWDFHLKIKEGAGAFVCGEETALIASIEGRRGMPRTRPPFPAVRGLWGKPTNINNVETYANVPWIIANGSAAYAAVGSETCKGTKAFSLAGKIVNGGLAEVPMGSTLRHVIFDVGGGVKDGKAFKAVQLGGPSGGCVPAALLDTPVDYESLAATGAIMGSGGMVVADESTCMVDLARYFLEFTQRESCGKCVPCRLGTKRMLEILERITAGEGEDGDIERLERLATTIKKTSLCGLGQTAPNPVLTTIRYFRDEYVAHIDEHRCPACACDALIAFSIDPDLCTGCTLCAKKCPVGAITGDKKQAHRIDQSLCVRCDSCRAACRFDAVKVVSGPEQIAAALRAEAGG